MDASVVAEDLGRGSGKKAEDDRLSHHSSCAF